MINPEDNPYPPGSDQWHRVNLGLDPNSVAYMGDPEITDQGIKTSGWYYGPGKIADHPSAFSVGYCTEPFKLIPMKEEKS